MPSRRVRAASRAGHERRFSAALRDALRDVHDRFESSGAIREHLRDLDGYRALLSAMRAVYAPLEAALTPYAPSFAARGIRLDERRKTPLLDLDLASVERPASAPVEPSPLSSEAEAWGVCYVLEGATLGGVVLAREIRRDLAIESRYYGGYGERTGPMWSAFLAALDAYADDASEETRERIALAAQETYARFERALA